MYRSPPKRTPRVAALISQDRKNALVVIDPWEVRVAMVAPIATVRLALLRERPTAVAANWVPPWLIRAGIEIISVAPADPEIPEADLPEMRRFAGSGHEKLINAALACADQALTHVLHEQAVPENRSRRPARAAAAAQAPRAPRSLPVPDRR